MQTEREIVNYDFRKLFQQVQSATISALLFVKVCIQICIHIHMLYDIVAKGRKELKQKGERDRGNVIISISCTKLFNFHGTRDYPSTSSIADFGNLRHVDKL